LIALPWFVLTESSGMVSTWSCLNGPDEFAPGFQRPLAILKILSVALIAAALTCSILRLLPQIILRKSLLSTRTWPATVVGVVVPVVWLSHSAMPWMIPEIVDVGREPDLRILHVVKRGLQFHETSISTYRGGTAHPRDTRSALQPGAPARIRARSGSFC
jgi:hypothetical protein